MGSDEPGDKAEPIGRKTALAEDRTLMASERSFAGWIRTGLAAVGIGLGFNALFRNVEAIWVAKAIASVFVLCGIFIFWAAERRARQVHARMNAHEVTLFAERTIRTIALVLSLAAAALIAAMWLLV